MKKILAILCLCIPIAIYGQIETDPVKRIYLQIDFENVTDSINLCNDDNVLNNLLFRYESILKELYQDKDLANHLIDLASYYSALGNYTEAIRLGTQALNIRKEVLGEKHPEYASSLANLANYYSALGNYTEAIRLSTETLNILKESLGEKHPVYALSLANLASYYYYLGNYTEAIRLSTETLNILKESLGEKHPDYASSLANLASYYSALGNYTEAIRLGTQALNILKESLGEKLLEYATSLNNLANYYSALGNYTEAIRLGTQALNIRKEVLGEKHPDYALSLANLAIYYYYLGNYTEAIRLGTQALNILKESLGENHPGYATSLNNLASYYSALGNYTEAIRLGTQALNIRKESLGENHPEYASSLANLANYYYALGNYTEAIRLGTQALNIRKESLGEKHPEYASSLANLASYNGGLNNLIETSHLLHKFFSITTENLFHNFSNLTSNERVLYWGKYNYTFSTFIPSITYKGHIQNPSLSELSFNSTLISKGILLNTEIELANLIAQSGDMEAEYLYNKLLATRRCLNKLYEKPISERGVDTDSLENVAKTLERELIEKSKVYGDFTHNLAIDWKQVQSKLGNDDIAIEFVSFPTDNDSVMYCALTLKKGYESPRMIPLFEEKQLNNIKKEKYYTTTYLSELIWGSLKDELYNVKNIYFAPAGELYNVAIESLRDFDGGEYVFDRWNFYRLSSTRELAKIKDEPNATQVALYGGLKYDPNGVFFEKDTLLQNGHYAQTRSLPDSIGLRSGYGYLRGTLEEVKHIDALYAEKCTPTSLFTDVVGTETSLKKLSGKGLSNLHISTHGFYWNETEVKADRDLRNLSFLHREDSPRLVEDKAMTRSGLLFAGANAILQGDSIPEGCDDGILTAQEIASLDFRGLDLLVLSACQTGLGEITGDGVSGLQRGFKKAGVQTIVMSLWKVDDDATQMLMTSFYENLLTGKTKREAFLEAQNEVRNFVGKINGTMRDFSNPKYWAGFILLDALN